MMEIYVLYHYWDTPDNEGSGIMGAYYDADNAIATMKAEVETVKSYFPADFWEEDFTWEDDYEIHLGKCGRTMNELATIYCWHIEKVEVK